MKNWICGVLCVLAAFVLVFASASGADELTYEQRVENGAVTLELGLGMTAASMFTGLDMVPSACGPANAALSVRR